MRAYEIVARCRGEVREVPSPSPGPGEVRALVRRVGICGTDVGLWGGDEARIERARTRYPIRPGHEWTGEVVQVGDGVDPGWVGRRVVADPMIGCGQCQHCRDGFAHRCIDRYEVGVRRGWPGALAEEIVVPASTLLTVPDQVSDDVAAMVEPAGNAVRALDAGAVGRGTRVVVVGPGTIGMLVSLIGRARGAEVTVLGIDDDSLALARSLDLPATADHRAVAELDADVVIDASTGSGVAALALQSVRPGGRVVLIGLAATPSTVDSRVLVHREITAVGVLGGSAGLAEALRTFASGAVDPTPLIADTITLTDVEDEFAGRRERAAGGAPKVLVDPRR